MGFLVALIVAALAWAVWTGKLSRQQLPPILVGLAGAFLAARGNLLLGVAAIGVGVTWYRGLTWRLFGKKPEQGDQYAVDKARFMLGVSRFDNAESIRERHRVLIAKNDPGTAGNEDRARELDKARDILLHDLETKAR